MSGNISRQAVLDDSDPRIQWTGIWFLEENVGQIGTWVSPFLNTLHGFYGGAAALSFSYYGTSVLVSGSLTPGFSPAGGTWQCLIDGDVVDNSDDVDWSVASNRPYTLCKSEGLANRIHILQVNFKGGEGVVWVDTVEYLAPTVADTADEWTRVFPYDQRIRYSRGWEVDDSQDGLTWTYTPGASFTYDFVGEAFTLSGYLHSHAALPGLGYYALDGQQPPIPFVIPVNNGLLPLFHHLHINISGLPPGPHHLEVSNGGNESTAALGFSHIFTKNALYKRSTSSKPPDASSIHSTSVSTSLTPSTTIPAPLPSSSPAQKPPTSAKFVEGGVSGGLFAVFLLMLTVFLRRRRKRRKERPGAVANRGLRESTGPVPDRQRVTTTISGVVDVAQGPSTGDSNAATSGLAPPPYTPAPPGPASFSQANSSLVSSRDREELPVQYTQDGRADITS